MGVRNVPRIDIFETNIRYEQELITNITSEVVQSGIPKKTRLRALNKHKGKTKILRFIISCSLGT